MPGDPAKKLATYQDVLDAPEHLVAELIRGSLSLLPRPRPKHARAASRIGMGLAGFDGAGAGPGGWIILDEPELHLGPEVVVPDLAGWRRERMPELPEAAAWFDLAPDWCCEVLSPSTERHDRGAKTDIYAESGVTHLWLVNPDLQLLEVLRLDGEGYRRSKTFAGADKVHAEPFDALEFDLGSLWAR